jgi:hypothetical protein
MKRHHPRVKCHALPIALALCLVTIPTVHAADHVDIKDWLARSGVRLVAVEFYATWCKPCMDAMPRLPSPHRGPGEAGVGLGRIHDPV